MTTTQSGTAGELRRIKILLLSANPTSAARLRITTEAREIETRLIHGGQKNAFEVIQRHAVGVDELGRALRENEADIVHFTGHGAEGGDAVLLEEQDGAARHVSAEGFAELVKSLAVRARVVFLNACNSEAIARRLAARIECVIGMSEAIRDHAAIDFAASFYEALGYGDSVESAFAYARKILGAKSPDQADIPVLALKDGVDAQQVLLAPPPAPAARQAPVAAPEERVQVVLMINLASNNPVSRFEIEGKLPAVRERRFYAVTDFGARPTPTGMGLDFHYVTAAVDRMMLKVGSDLSDGQAASYVIAGRGPLPIFAHLGMKLSTHAEQVTLLNRRADDTWDEISLGGAPPVGGETFFQVVRGLDSQEPVVADGRVAVFVSTNAPLPREEIYAFFKEQQAPLAGIVEVRAQERGEGILDAARTRRASSELVDVIKRLQHAYPRSKSLALFVAGPTTLAFIAGRAINPNIFPDVWIPNHESRAYRFAAALLPGKERVRPLPSESADAELARRDVLDAVREGIAELTRSLQAQDLRSLWPEADTAQLLERARALRIAREPQGEAFHLSVVEGSMAFGRELLEALRSMSKEDCVLVGRALFLHELVHFDQNLLSGQHMGVGRAGVALEEVDYWADIMAAGTLAAWEIRRLGESGRERAREIVTRCLNAVLLGMEAFDLFEHGPRIEALAERRLRRYLIWHLQCARASTLKAPEDMDALFRDRLIVELAPLTGHLDERHDKIVDAVQDSTELFVVLGARLLRTQRQPSFDPRVLVGAVRTFDRHALTSAMKSIRDHHRGALVPWVR